MNTALRIVQDETDTTGRRDYINRSSKLEPKYDVLFADFIEKTIARKAKRMSANYPANYRTLIMHLNNFSEQFNAIIFTNSVNEEFLDDFIVYLEEKNLKLNYIKTLVDLAKAMVKKAANYGYAVDSTYDDVEIDNEEPFSVYLSMNEITRIYYYQGLSKKQQRVRDLFVIGCLTALRYSDYSMLEMENFQDEYIVKLTKKTKKKVMIPIHDYVKEIYQKYDGNLMFGLCPQHFNRYVKMICKKIGFNEDISFTYTRGGKLITETKKKWELISSHTARRSAATNMYLTRRMSLLEIMNITGHTTEKSFFRYIRVTLEALSKQIAGDPYFRK